MGTRTTTNVVASKSDAGTGVATTPTAAGVSATPLSPARTAIRTALTLVAQATAAAAPYSRSVPGPTGGRGGRVPKNVALALPNVVRVMRGRPNLASGQDLDAIEEAVALAADLRELDTQTTGFEVMVSTTSRLTLADAWGRARPMYAAAKVKARTDNLLATQVAPLTVALSVGPRAASSQRVAQAAQARTDAAQRRADAAAHKAVLAQQRADLAKRAADLATAARAAAAGHVPPAPAAPAPTPPTPATPASAPATR